MKKITDECMKTARNDEILKTIGENQFDEYKKGNLKPNQAGTPYSHVWYGLE